MKQYFEFINQQVKEEEKEALIHKVEPAKPKVQNMFQKSSWQPDISDKKRMIKNSKVLDRINHLEQQEFFEGANKFTPRYKIENYIPKDVQSMESKMRLTKLIYNKNDPKFAPNKSSYSLTLRPATERSHIATLNGQVKASRGSKRQFLFDTPSEKQHSKDFYLNKNVSYNSQNEVQSTNLSQSTSRRHTDRVDSFASARKTEKNSISTQSQGSLPELKLKLPQKPLKIFKKIPKEVKEADESSQDYKRLNTFLTLQTEPDYRGVYSPGYFLSVRGNYPVAGDEFPYIYDSFRVNVPSLLVSEKI